MLPISLTMAGIAALINIILSARIGRVRASEKISIGDGGNQLLIARMRAQANFIEYTPLFLILLALIEFGLSGGDASNEGPLWLWIVGGIFMLGRIGHAFGMDGRFKQGRVVGTLITAVSLLGLGLYALVLPHLSPPAHVETQIIPDTQ